MGGTENDTLDGGSGQDILIGDSGQDSYVLKAGNRGIDIVKEQSGEISTVKLEGLELTNLIGQQEGDDLVLTGLDRTQGLVLKDYFTEAGDWKVSDYTGEAYQLSEVLSDNRTRLDNLNRVAQLEEAFMTSWRTEMASDLLNNNAIQLADGRFEQKPQINFNYNQTTYTSSSAQSSSESGWFNPPYLINTSLAIKTFSVEEAGNQGWYIWGWEENSSYSVMDVTTDQWTINQSSNDYDQYTYQWVSRSQYITLPPGVSGFSIPGSYNLRVVATNEPGTYWLSWQENQKTISAHVHSIDINGQANVLSVAPTTEEQLVSAQTLGRQILAGQDLPVHLIVGIQTLDVSLNAIQVEGTEGNDDVAFGSAYAQIIHGRGGDDVIDISYINEGPIAKGFLDGGDGNDTIIGGYNNDILIGGNGINYLQGGYGADRYVLSGDGVDLINPWQDHHLWRSNHTDAIELPEGITLDMLTAQYGTVFIHDKQATYVPTTLNINWSGKTQAMVVLPFALPYYPYETETLDAVELRFSDGTVAELETLLASAQAADSRPYSWSESMSSNNFRITWYIPLMAVEFRMDMGEITYSDYAGGIEFLDDISPDDVKYMKSGNDLLITSVSGSDSLRLQDWYIRSDKPEARFSDGQVREYEFLSNEGLTLSGTDENDTLIAADDYGWDLLGLAGHDVLQGEAGDDYLDGGEGEDTLIGNFGNDYLEGGTGNDKLLGGGGSDTYYFGNRSGKDTLTDQTISSSGDINTVIMDDDLLPEHISVYRDQSHIIFSINDTNDELAIQWDKQNGYFIQQVEFADGTVWDAEKLESIAIPLNNAPILVSPISAQNVIENHLFSFQIPVDTFIDNDTDDFLTFGVKHVDGSPLPVWLEFNPVTRVFSGTPGLEDAGMLSLIVTATDTGGLSASAAFDLQITNFIEGTNYIDRIVGSSDMDFISTGSGDDRVDGGEGNDTIIGGHGNDVLLGGNGDDIFIIEGKNNGNDRFEGGNGIDTIQGGIGNDIICVRNFKGNNTVERIDGGLGVNKLVGTQNNDTIDLSATELVNIASIEGRKGNDKIIGSEGAERLDGGAGSDALAGGTGDDIYIMGRGYGTDTILEKDATVGNKDTVQFLSDIAADQIWFRHVRNNLEVSIIGTPDKLIIKDWYLDTANHVEQFKTADGETLLDSQVNNLVSAMASFSPRFSSQFTPPMDYHRALEPIIAANWQ
ncbi:MAG: hypothetical protein HOP23_14265 [Methylococcaceae bacterium]|nr:hypothetical protein [Methylococcaceae bacterium]